MQRGSGSSQPDRKCSAQDTFPPLARFSSEGPQEPCSTSVLQRISFRCEVICASKGIPWAHWDCKWWIIDHRCLLTRLHCFGGRGQSGPGSKAALALAHRRLRDLCKGQWVSSVSSLSWNCGKWSCVHEWTLFVYRVPTPRYSRIVESRLRCQWEYLHIAISIKT